ncbi:MAG: hypothetical protein K0U41_06715 [Gammaproteobacteria bacterium]|nr:hypothetical protein [Gammaproteobacteria bacterium]
MNNPLIWREWWRRQVSEITLGIMDGKGTPPLDMYTPFERDLIVKIKFLEKEVAKYKSVCDKFNLLTNK